MTAEPDNATQAIREAAAEWVLRLQDGNLPGTDTAAFVAWLRHSPVHIREYLHAESTWLALEDIDPRRAIDLDALLVEGEANVVHLLRAPQVARGASEALTESRRASWRMAAAACVAAVIAGLFLFGGIDRRETYATALGEQRTIALEDGSVMELNTASEVQVKITTNSREIELLRGEAFFTVRKDPARPFRVASRGIQVQALGTQFDVYHHDEQTVVTVLEGEVEVRRVASDSNRGTPFRLAVGGQAVVGDHAQSVTVDDANVARSLAWRERKLVFADEPLVNVIAEVNRYNTRQLRIADATLGARRISGVFDIHDPEVIVRFLERSIAIRITTTPAGEWALALDTTQNAVPQAAEPVAGNVAPP